MSKAEKILGLYDGRRTPREIAEIVGCGPSYVRVVARQRKGGTYSSADERYLASKLGRQTRKNYTENQALIRRSGDKAAANEAAREAYRQARDAGASAAKAKRKAWGAARRVLLRTAYRAIAAQKAVE